MTTDEYIALTYEQLQAEYAAITGCGDTDKLDEVAMRVLRKVKRDTSLSKEESDQLWDLFAKVQVEYMDACPPISQEELDRIASGTKRHSDSMMSFSDSPYITKNFKPRRASVELDSATKSN